MGNLVSAYYSQHPSLTVLALGAVIEIGVGCFHLWLKYGRKHE